MLERIGNVSLEVDFNKSKKGKYSHSKGGIYENASFNINDSISFSPASKYLSRANWLLKEFQHSSEDKVIVEFIYGGFYFEVHLDLKSINSLETISYTIRKDDSIRVEINPIIASLKIVIGTANESMPLQKELKGLGQLFNRFTSLDLKNELNIYNYELIDTLLDGIYSSLQSDFTYLNNILFNFLEKQTNRKLNVMLNKNKNATELNLIKIRPF
ncbi:MAG: hypothetical protein KKF62_01355 [Bacteroidetes bacterium]|nr:hypothetical protein [Bacteroidota bacterium]MBU1115137.1 hypothetical protein [Bacteroidota bacterium]MBU1799276.1 hypothetical protein [Bacteroidota bacterium]